MNRPPFPTPKDRRDNDQNRKLLGDARSELERSFYGAATSDFNGDVLVKVTFQTGVAQKITAYRAVIT